MSTPAFPPATREGVIALLLAQLNTLLTTNTPVAGPFVTISRRVILWYDQAPEFKPSLFIQEPEEVGMPTPRGTPTKREWVIHLIMYAEVPIGGASIGAVVINNLIDALENCLGLQAGNAAPATLGGTVYRLWQEGTIRKDPGDIDGHALAVYPIRLRPP